jgi:DNA-binding MarR family transcriptional regulator
MNDIAPHTEACVLQLFESAATLERQLDRGLSSTRGISFSEYRLLTVTAGTEANGIPRIDLAHAVGLTPSAVTRALKPLEKLGYVTTEKSERDARQSRAVITAAGRELLNDAQAVMRDSLRTLPLNKLSQQQVSDFRTRLAELRSTR